MGWIDITPFVTGENLTATKFNNMAFNEFAINQKKIEAKISNIESGGDTGSPRWVINNIGIFARTVSVTPGSDLRIDSENLPYFSKTITFPSNMFHANYQPIVLATPQGNRALPQSVLLTKITDTYVNYTIYILEEESILPSRTFYVDFMAIGVVPEEGAFVDNDYQPTSD